MSKWYFVCYEQIMRVAWRDVPRRDARVHATVSAVTARPAMTGAPPDDVVDAIAVVGQPSPMPALPSGLSAREIARSIDAAPSKDGGATPKREWAPTVDELLFWCIG